MDKRDTRLTNEVERSQMAADMILPNIVIRRILFRPYLSDTMELSLNDETNRMIR